MNITELARKLKLNAQELREKLPALGFDIGLKAIKVDDQLASKIIRAWREFSERERQKEQYLKYSKKDEDTEGGEGNAQLEIPSVLTVKDFAELLKRPVTFVISELIKNGVMTSMNERIDYDTAAIVAADMGYETKEISPDEKVEVDKAKKIKDVLEKQIDKTVRAPIIVVMGHVDHGKTKLLDSIRNTNVMGGEAGGITQHIGAYQVERRGRKITFIDTPGHEAFTAMRSRGAKVADIAILVVAANEGVKPQTVESIKIAQSAEIPVVVAVNKIDLPDANIEKVKQELAQYNLLAEEWGGQVAFVPISAKLNQNIDELLDTVLLTADMIADKIQANPGGEFIGSIVESHVSKGEGPVATVLVKNGTLHVGDYVTMAGVLYGKIRTMKNQLGVAVTIAEPSMPAEIFGLKVAPKVGDVLEVIDDPRKATRAKIYTMQKQDETFLNKNDLSEENKENLTELNIVLRADVLGSQEAIIESLKKMEAEGIRINFVAKGLGNVNESDVSTAEATGAMLLGFNVLPSTSASNLARDKKMEIKIYKIIYELIDEVKRKLNEIIKPETVRTDLGKMQVLMLFKKGNDWQVLGGKVTTGKVEPRSKVAVIRAGQFLTSGKITALQIGKQEVTDAVKGQECGIKFEGQPIIEKDDVLEVYKETEVRKIV
ncbi:MAG: Translation initiation factor IF-2 [Parcubacteria group bacterium GW2011_GWC2_39_14]|nr:MAG: Translation initiation factor IF-2 [Parcubacteria group bacterium GW2011_GWC2_39_14]KKR53813.1 MAG: Translation initiation factor IF-2 [Parcubacteria group bacterium GW2011_GWA2_40_23]